VFEQTADPTTVTLVPSATLVDPTPEAGAALGTSVSLEGGTAIVGAPYADIGGNLDQGGALVWIAPLTTPFSGTPVPDGELFDPFGGTGDHYGTAVAIGDTLAVVGVPNAGTQANKAPKALGGVAKPGEAIAIHRQRDLPQRHGIVARCTRRLRQPGRGDSRQRPERRDQRLHADRRDRQRQEPRRAACASRTASSATCA
jgi:hypothetical protein